MIAFFLGAAIALALCALLFSVLSAAEIEKQLKQANTLNEQLLTQLQQLLQLLQLLTELQRQTRKLP